MHERDERDEPYGDNLWSDERAEQDSLAPIQLQRLSVEDEAALMLPSTSPRLAIVAALAGLLLVAGAYGMQQLDIREARVNAAAAVRTLQATQVEGFVRCVMPGVALAQVATKERMLGALDTLGEQRGVQLARVLGECSHRIEALIAGIKGVKSPADLKAFAAAMVSSASRLDASLVAYREYLMAAGADYNYVTALPVIERVADDWSEYLHHEAAFQAAARTRGE